MVRCFNTLCQVKLSNIFFLLRTDETDLDKFAIHKTQTLHDFRLLEVCFSSPI